MLKHIAVSVRVTGIMLVICCGIYPLVVWAVGQVAFRHQADGSLVRNASGRIVGSELLAQGFTKPYYFHPRPSDAGAGYDPTQSGGSNLGPTSSKLIAQVKQRAQQYRAENGLAPNALVPVDAVTASASGLDPEISTMNAKLQAPRVARARGLSLGDVDSLIGRCTRGRALGFLGEPGVNVLELNLTLDHAAPMPSPTAAGARR